MQPLVRPPKWSWKLGTVSLSGTRLEGTYLDFCIELDEAAVAAVPDDLDALRRLGEHYTRRGRFADGLRVDRELVRRVEPADRHTAYYNLACSLALTGDTDAAFVALEQALTHGYRDKAHLAGDSDMQSLRADPRFAALLARL